MFRHRVTFQAPVESQDPVQRGGRDGEWEPVFEDVPAAVEQRSVRESVGGAQMQVTTAITVTVRWRPGLNAKQRIVWQTRGRGAGLQHLGPGARQAHQQHDRRDPGGGAGVMADGDGLARLPQGEGGDLGGQGAGEVHAAAALHRGLADPRDRLGRGRARRCCSRSAARR